MNTYRVLLPLTVHTEDGAYGQGDEFSKDFSPEDEWENVQSGLLEIVPTEWKVIGESRVHDTEPGGTFSLGIPLARQEQLKAHIEPVPPPKPAKPSRKKKGS